MLSKIDTTWKIDVNNSSVCSLQGLRLHDDFANKSEEFYNLNTKNVLTTISAVPHKLFAAGIQIGERDLT